MYLDDPATNQKEAQLERAFVLYRLAVIISQTGDHTIARQMYAQSQVLYESLGDRWGVANAVKGQGILCWDSSAYVQAQELLEKSLKIYREIGDQRGIAASLSWLGSIALFQGQVEGERLIRESRDIYAALGDYINMVEAADQACMALMMLGRYDKARDLMQEKVMLDHRMDFRQDATYALLASALIHLGEYQEARIYAQTGLDIARQLGDAFGLGFALVVRGWLALADGQYEVADTLFQEGTRHCENCGLQELSSWALACQGLVELSLGKLELAAMYLASALRTALEIKGVVGIKFAFTSSILLTAALGAKEQALERYALALQHPMVANSVWFDQVIGSQIESFAADLPLDVVMRAKARGQEQTLDTLVIKILSELEAGIVTGLFEPPIPGGFQRAVDG
jgi:tetratricopeptide (TPR) repeat protein